LNHVPCTLQPLQHVVLLLLVLLLQGALVSSLKKDNTLVNNVLTETQKLVFFSTVNNSILYFQGHNIGLILLLMDLLLLTKENILF